MNESKLGRPIYGEEFKDAVHIAIAPVVAAEELYPGAHVGLNGQGEATTKQTPHIGVVDPFLKHNIFQGQTFWLCLYPNTIRSIRHDWDHPAFSGENPATYDSRMWLEGYAARLSPYDNPKVAFDNLIDGLKNHEVFAHGTDLHYLEELDDASDLKYHAERYLGIKIEWETFSFSCSC